MSKFSYNGITLPFAYCTSFIHEAVADNLSNTDWILSKFDITIQSVINTDFADFIGVSGSNPAEIMNNARTKLMARRKSLEYLFGSVNLIPSKQNVAGQNGTVDAMNGPMPQTCTYIQLTDTTFLLTYRIIAHYWESPQTVGGALVNRAGNDVLSNRWSESVSIVNNYTTLTREGTYQIRSDNVSSLIADEIRESFAVVAVPEGFLRERADYTVDPSGLLLKYTIVDKEYYFTPPYPALVSDGYYMESSTHNGNLRFGEVSVHLESDKGGDRSALAAMAVSVAASKLRIEGARIGTSRNFVKLESATLKIDLYKNEVTCTMKCLMQARMGTNQRGRARHQGLAGINYEQLASAPLRSAQGDAQPDYFTRGSAGILLQAAAYYDPSLSATRLDAESAQMTTGKEVGKAGQGE